MSLHCMGAAISKIPELELEQPEAERLGTAVARVNELYGNFVMTEKQLAVIGLVMAAGSIYGPRFVAVTMRKKKEREGEPQTIAAHEPRIM